ncbi:MAG: DegV family protein [Clostridia bacterium]|nr:DegV family protein [Clostridia bacterium]
MEKRLFEIVTDSTCDMPASYYKEHGIEVVNLGFTMNNVNYEGENGEKISEKEFYKLLREGSMPTTYQVTAETAKPHIEKFLQQGKDVLILAFSSALSGTAGSFSVAARELSKKYPKRKIRVIDSLCASMGEGLLLDYLIKKADGGASLEETAKYAEDLKLHICHHFTVDNLFHLKRGGRVSTATAIFGSVLKIKPIMHVSDEGRLVAIGKAMGRKKSLNCLVENLFASADMDENDPIFISHGDCMEDVEYVKRQILEKMPKAKIFVYYVGSVIGAHAGAGVVALFNKGKKR